LNALRNSQHWQRKHQDQSQPEAAKEIYGMHDDILEVKRKGGAATAPPSPAKPVSELAIGLAALLQLGIVVAALQRHPVSFEVL
jgi:hypothetical protein